MKWKRSISSPSLSNATFYFGSGCSVALKVSTPLPQGARLPETASTRTWWYLETLDYVMWVQQGSGETWDTPGPFEVAFPRAGRNLLRCTAQGRQTFRKSGGLAHRDVGTLRSRYVSIIEISIILSIETVLHLTTIGHFYRTLYRWLKWISTSLFKI